MKIHKKISIFVLAMIGIFYFFQLPSHADVALPNLVVKDVEHRMVLNDQTGSFNGKDFEKINHVVATICNESSVDVTDSFYVDIRDFPNGYNGFDYSLVNDYSAVLDSLDANVCVEVTREYVNYVEPGDYMIWVDVDSHYSIDEVDEYNRLERMVTLRQNEIFTRLYTGDLMKSYDSPNVYVFDYDVKRLIPDEQSFLELGYTWDQVNEVDQSIIDLVPAAKNLIPTLKNHSLVKSETSDKVYYIDNYVKRWVYTPALFQAYGWTWSDVSIVSDQDLSQYSEGLVLHFPNGTLVKDEHSPDVYYIIDGFFYDAFRRFENEESFLQHGFRWDDIIVDKQLDLTSYGEYPDITTENPLSNEDLGK